MEQHELGDKNSNLIRNRFVSGHFVGVAWSPGCIAAQIERVVRKREPDSDILPMRVSAEVKRTFQGTLFIRGMPIYFRVLSGAEATNCG
jgi:hypothetical protein